MFFIAINYIKQYICNIEIHLKKFRRMEKLMKKNDVAEAFGVTVKAVDKWVCQKKIPYIKISGKCVRFRPSVIRGFLEKRTVKPEVRPSLKTK